MVWLSGLASAGLGIGGGLLQSRNQRKLKKRREPFLAGADQFGQQLLGETRGSIERQQQIVNKGFRRASSLAARTGYNEKRDAVMRERQQHGRALQQGIDTGLITSSVFQGARRGITAETSSLLSSIGQRVQALRADLDMRKTEADVALQGARGDTSRLAHDLGMASAERWLMHQTGAGFGELPQAPAVDFSGLGNVAKFLFKGTAPGGKSLLDWIF